MGRDMAAGWMGWDVVKAVEGAVVVRGRRAEEEGGGE